MGELTTSWGKIEQLVADAGVHIHEVWCGSRVTGSENASIRRMFSQGLMAEDEEEQVKALDKARTGATTAQEHDCYSPSVVSLEVQLEFH
jgi:hypothetical protein